MGIVNSRPSSLNSCSSRYPEAPIPTSVSPIHIPFTHHNCNKGRTYITPPTTFSAKIYPKPSCNCCVHEKCPHPCSHPYSIKAELFNPDKLKPLVMDHTHEAKKAAQEAKRRWRKVPREGLPHRPTCGCEWCVEARVGEVREVVERRKHWYWRVVLHEKAERELFEEMLGTYSLEGSGRASATSSEHSTTPDREWLRYTDEEEEVAPHQWMGARWDAPRLCPKQRKSKSWELPSSF